MGFYFRALDQPFQVKHQEYKAFILKYDEPVVIFSLSANLIPIFVFSLSFPSWLLFLKGSSYKYSRFF